MTTNRTLPPAQEFGQEQPKDLCRRPLYVRFVNTTAAHPGPPNHRRHNTITTNNLKKMLVGTLLSGGVALVGFGLTAGTAYATPEYPGINPATKIHVAVQGNR